MNAIDALEKKQMIKRPNISVGDTVIVDTLIREKNKTRVQKFKGIVIAIKVKCITITFTVRKVSYGIGVEKIFPLYSTNIPKIEIVKHANVRRSKIYFLRDRIGKAATTLKHGKDLDASINDVTENEPEEQEEVVAEVTETAETKSEEVSKEEK